MSSPRAPAAGSRTAWAMAVVFVLLALLPALATAVKDPFILVIATRIMIFAIAAPALRPPATLGRGSTRGNHS